MASHWRVVIVLTLVEAPRPSSNDLLFLQEFPQACRPRPPRRPVAHLRRQPLLNVLNQETQGVESRPLDLLCLIILSIPIRE